MRIRCGIWGQWDLPCCCISECCPCFASQVRLCGCKVVANFAVASWSKMHRTMWLEVLRGSKRNENPNLQWEHSRQNTFRGVLKLQNRAWNAPYTYIQFDRYPCTSRTQYLNIPRRTIHGSDCLASHICAPAKAAFFDYLIFDVLRAFWLRIQLT